VSEISERYQRLSDAFAAKIAAVGDDQWSSPTPCAEWTIRDLVGHVVSTQGMFLGFVGQELGDVPSIDDDPLGAWNATRTAVQANLDDPARATVEFDGFFGRQSFEGAVDRFLSIDLVVHGWDLARAAGLDERMEPEDVERVRRVAEGFGESARSPQVFGPPLDAPEGANDQERLLAFLGRQV
jgi:uncharacterized protein (TIGR03086 family)